MSNFANSESVILKRVRLDYFDVFQKGAPQDEKDKANPDKWAYKAKVIFPPDSEAAAAAKGALLAAARALWGDNAVQMVQSIPANSKAVRNGDHYLKSDGSSRPEYVGQLFVACANKKQKPQVVAQKKHNGKFVTITEDGRGLVDGIDVTHELGYPITVPYRGCYVNLKVQFTAGKADPSKQMPNQVFAKLEAIQFVSDGEAFGAGPTSAEGFDDEEVTASGVDDDALFG